MNALKGYGKLCELEAVTFTTDQASLILECSLSAASKTLRRLSDNGLAEQVVHGHWTVKKGVSLADVSEGILWPEPSYISYYSALFQHGMLSQIPRRLHVVSTGPARQIMTSKGEITVNQMQPNIFGGFYREGHHWMASPEKALFDTVYIAMGRRQQAIGLPEIEIPKTFEVNKVWEWNDKISNLTMRERMKRHLKHVLQRSIEGEAQVLDG